MLLGEKQCDTNCDDVARRQRGRCNGTVAQIPCQLPFSAPLLQSSFTFLHPGEAGDDGRIACAPFSSTLETQTEIQAPSFGPLKPWLRCLLWGREPVGERYFLLQFSLWFSLFLYPNLCLPLRFKMKVITFLKRTQAKMKKKKVIRKETRTISEGLDVFQLKKVSKLIIFP